MKTYLILGSDNHWYAADIKDLETAQDEINNIMAYPDQYGKTEAPETLYIYEGKEIDEIETKKDYCGICNAPEDADGNCNCTNEN